MECTVLTYEGLEEKLKDTPSGRYGKYSIQRAKIVELVNALLEIAKERGYAGDDITPFDCEALFQGKLWTEAGGWSKEGQRDLKFHPIEIFSELYSTEWPERISTYDWNGFTLKSKLVRILDEFETLFPPHADGSSCYWLDILFMDYNEPDTVSCLEISEMLYSLTPLHFASLCRGLLSRARIARMRPG